MIEHFESDAIDACRIPAQSDRFHVTFVVQSSFVAMRYAFDIPLFLEWVVETWAPVREQANRAAYSRSHFSRVFVRDVGESPAALKRRLQLEAAAHLLASTDYSIGEVALEVGFQAPEAFAKAFKRTYGSNPRSFRKSKVNFGLLKSASGIHFHPSGLIVRRQGEPQMNLNHILIRQHVDEITRILGEMSKLSDEELDRDTVAHGDAIPWDRHARSLRDTLRHIIATHAIWLAALKGEPLPESLSAKPTLGELSSKHEETAAALLDLVDEVEKKNLWASEFVDALCEEPQRFAFGAVLAHILVFGIHRRMLALAALRSLGLKRIEYGDPINWLRQQQGEAAYIPDCV